VGAVLGAAKTATGGAAKKIQGRKRQHCDRYLRSAGRRRGAPADVLDRDGAVLVTRRPQCSWVCAPSLAASVYNGPNCPKLSPIGQVRPIEIVKRAETLSAFNCVPRRWVVERTLDWAQSQTAALSEGFSRASILRAQGVGFTSHLISSSLEISLTLLRMYLR